jgi:hypothetical protein
MIRPWAVLLLATACHAPEAVQDAAQDVAISDTGSAPDAVKEGVQGDAQSIFCDLDCDDLNPCTDDVCYIKIGCTHIPHSGNCDDGNACTTGDFCVDDTCAGQLVNCDDGNSCTDDVCLLPGTCTHTSHC